MLNNLSTTELEYTSIYAIGIGLVVYACIYLYFLFYNEEFLSIFNKFIIYIIGIDLLLSSFYYAHNKNSLEYKQIENSDNFSDDISENISEEYDIEDNIEDNIDDNIENLQLHTEDLLENEEFNIESDVESNFEVPSQTNKFAIGNVPSQTDEFAIGNVPSQTDEFAIGNVPSQTDEFAIGNVPSQTDEFAIGNVPSQTDEPIQEQISDNKEQLETKKRRGRKPNSAKLHF